MNCGTQEGNLYYIAWSVRGLEEVFNYTSYDKQFLYSILSGKVDSNLEGNHVRSMIVTAVSNNRAGTEIWQVLSTLNTEDIIAEFNQSPEELKQEIRSTGELIYTTIGKIL